MISIFACGFRSTDTASSGRLTLSSIIWNPPPADFGDIQRISRRFRSEIRYMNTKWGHVIANDPYYSPNLTVKSGDFSLAFPPRAPKPWLSHKADPD